MKLLIFLAVVAYASGAAVQDAATRWNLNMGWPNSGDKLLYRNYFYKSPIGDAIQFQDVTYIGNYGTRITAIQASEVGYTMYAAAYIRSGGIGSSNVTVRLTTARGNGYYYLVDIWGY